MTRSFLSFLCVLFIYLYSIYVESQQCGYYILPNTNQPYIMNKCHSNIPQSSLTLRSSSIYNCSSSNVLTHYHWQDSSTCSGQPLVITPMYHYNCSLPECQCGDVQHCQMWSKHQKTNCVPTNISNNTATIHETQSIMVNECFMGKYRNICDKDGTLYKLTYQHENEDEIDDEMDESGCDDDEFEREIIHQHENITGYCFEYYCDESGGLYDVDEDTDTNENEPNVSSTYEEPEVLTPVTPSVNANLSWLLPIIAVLALLIIVVYCWMLKAPNVEKYDKIGRETV